MPSQYVKWIWIRAAIATSELAPVLRDESHNSCYLGPKFFSAVHL